MRLSVVAVIGAVVSGCAQPQAEAPPPQVVERIVEVPAPPAPPPQIVYVEKPAPPPKVVYVERPAPKAEPKPEVRTASIPDARPRPAPDRKPIVLAKPTRAKPVGCSKFTKAVCELQKGCHWVKGKTVAGTRIRGGCKAS